MNLRRWILWGLMLALGVGGAVQLAAQPPADPEARKTWRAERQAERQAMDPEARAARRAERQQRQERMMEKRQQRMLELREKMPPAKVELHEPLPLPVEVKNAGGKPAGGACPANNNCKLTMEPPSGEVIVVTSVWSATTIECDDMKASAPPNGAAVAPWWRCEKGLQIEGPGAGWLGFTVAK